MDYKESIRWLYSRQESGIKLGLTSIIKLLNELKVPDPKMPIIHVAGTNGKGSTCAFMDSILRASGHRTGLFTSPHLFHSVSAFRWMEYQPMKETLPKL